MAYNACKAYGVFPVPNLSIAQFHLVGWLLLTTILLACHPGLAPRFFLFASLVLYFMYFGQLFCESKHGGHGSVLMPSVFLLLALSGGPRSTPWSLVFIKIFLGIIYFAGAVSKLAVSQVFGQTWSGSTMQAYVMDAMWTRPHRLGLVRAFQRFCVSRWYVCTFLALSGLVFELGFLPLYLFGGHLGASAAALIAYSFHLGVDVLQGLDFKPFWCPVFWVFLPDLQAVLMGIPGEPWTAVVSQGYEEETFRWMASALYLLIQVVVSIGFFDIRGWECLPFTCCPMFAVPRNMFGDEVRGGVMTEFDLRDGGFMDMSYNFTPWHTDMPLSEENLRQLQGRMMVWTSTVHLHPLIHHIITEDAHGKELLLASNFEMAPDFRAKITEYAQYLADCRPEDWMDSQKVFEAIILQEQCRSMFTVDSQEARLLQVSKEEFPRVEEQSPVLLLLSCLGLYTPKV